MARFLHGSSARADGAFVIINARRCRRTAWIANCSASKRDRRARGRRVRTGPRRHALPRRSRRHAAGDPRQDRARAGGPEFSPRRRGLPPSMSTSGSSPRRAATWPRRSPMGIFARTYSTVCPSSRSVRPRSPNVARTSPNSCTHFMEQVTAVSMGVPPRAIASDAMAVLQSHDWPGDSPSTPQQRRTPDDPRLGRRKGERNHRRHAALRDRRPGAGGADRRRRRKS